MQRFAPWDTELPDDLTPAQGYQLARDRIAWRAAGRPDPTTLDDWPDDDDLNYLLSRHSHDTLDLNGLKLRKIPDELYRSEGIAFLFLMDNRIETVPEKFGKHFGLSSCRFSEIRCARSRRHSFS